MSFAKKYSRQRVATGGISESERVFGGREITPRARDKSGMANDGGPLSIPRRQTLQEAAMAKAKKRVTTRKKSLETRD